MNPHDRATPTSTAEAEREAARTRIELATTLDALHLKVSDMTTRHLVEKGFNMIRDGLNASDGINRSLDVVRANPIPIALIGIGAAWLVASNTGVVNRIAQSDRVEVRWPPRSPAVSGSAALKTSARLARSVTRWSTKPAEAPPPAGCTRRAMWPRE
jgi:hypothetical protein